MEKQGGKCALCQETLRDGEDQAHHTAPLVDSCRGQAQTLRLLCGVCHAHITDGGARRGDILQSFFNPWTHSFVTSPRPVPATFTANAGDGRRAPFILADIRRCRRNIAYEGPAGGWPAGRPGHRAASGRRHALLS